MTSRWTRALVAGLLGAVLATAHAATAHAAVTLTLNPATVAGSDFSWSCVVNPGGGTTYVSGASWIAAGGADFVETARVAVSGSTLTTVAFSRDGRPNQTYQYRCKAYATPTGGSPTVSTKLEVTTYGDTRYGVLVSTNNEPGLANTLTDYIGEYDEHRALMGGAPVGVRVFSSGEVPNPGDPGPTYPEEVMAWVAANHPDESITVSFKSYSGTRLSNLLNWAQAHTVELTVIYFHEVQDDWGADRTPGAEPGLYRGVYQQMRTIIDAHPWRTHITLEKNMNWYWQAIQAPSLGADWREYVQPKNASGVRTDPADVVNWDAYSPLEWRNKPRGYATPAEFMQHALEVWNEAGLPWGYGEIGAVPATVPGDAAWVAATQAWADAARTPALAGPAFADLPPARTFKYWCAHHNNKVYDYHLEQNPAAVTMYRPYVRSMPMLG